LNGIKFLFGDERCVPPDHVDSNYALVLKTLLDKGMSSGCTIARMEAENPDREAAAKAYEKLLPEAVDVLLLGMGADGHIASLFPGSSALLQRERSVIPVKGPKLPYKRLTVTPKVIASAKSTFLLVTGNEKGVVLAEALRSESDFMSLPVRLTLAGTWLLDAEAGCQLKG
jgi:6-phosphogluconolactonase